MCRHYQKEVYKTIEVWYNNTYDYIMNKVDNSINTVYMENKNVI